MNPAQSSHLLSVKAFLFGNESDSGTVETLSHSLNERGVAEQAIEGVRRLPGAALAAADREIATVTAGNLDLNLGGLLVSGWRKHADLVAAAKRTIASPGSEAVVVLASHRVTSSHRSHVDLLVDEVKVTTLRFELKLDFDLRGIVAVVRHGELTALRSGECVVAAALSLEGVQVTQRQGRVDLAVVVPLDPPIHLADAKPGEAAPSEQGEAAPSEQGETATPFLEVVSPGPLLGRRVVVTRDQLVVGRNPDSDAHLEDPRVSRTHALLRREGDHVYVQDLGSTGGTTVNRTSVVGSHRLVPGDLVSFASLDLVFRSG